MKRLLILLVLGLAWPAFAGIFGGLRWRGCMPVLAAEYRAGRLSVADETRELETELGELGTEIRNELHAREGSSADDSHPLVAIQEKDIAGLQNEVRRLLKWLRTLAKKHGLEKDLKEIEETEEKSLVDRIRQHQVLIEKILGENGSYNLRQLLHWTQALEIPPRDHYLAVIGEKEVTYHRVMVLDVRAWENRFWINEGLMPEPSIVEGDRPLLPHERTTAQFLMERHLEPIIAIAEKTDGTRSDGDVQIGEWDRRELKALLETGADSERVVKVVLESMARGGQSPLKTIDARGSGLTQGEARRAIGRLAGKLREAPIKLNRLRSLVIIGDGFESSVQFISTADYMTLVEQSTIHQVLQGNFDDTMQNANPFPARLDVFVPQEKK